MMTAGDDVDEMVDLCNYHPGASQLKNLPQLTQNHSLKSYPITPCRKDCEVVRSLGICACSGDDE